MMFFFLPLFFFISGFLMYREGRFKKRSDVWRFIWNKFQALMIPTIIFSLAFALVFNRPYLSIVNETSKYGFWFTYTLWFFFAIYAVGDHVISRFLHGYAKIVIGLFFALLLFAFAKYSLTASCPWHGSTISDVAGFANFQHFLFFFTGALARRFFSSFQEILDSQIGMAIIVISFIAFEACVTTPALSNLIISISYSFFSLIKAIAGFFGVILSFAFFRKYSGKLGKSSLTGRTLQEIGKRSLDVYLLHLFLVYGDLNPIGEFFSAHHNPAMELIVGMVVSLLIAGICLLISDVLRCSDLVAKLLFGRVLSKSES